MRRLTLLLTFFATSNVHAQRADVALRAGIDVLKGRTGNDDAVNAAITDNRIMATASLTVAYRTKRHLRIGVVADYRRAPYNYSYWTYDDKNYPTKHDIKGTSAYIPVRAFVNRTFTIKAFEPYVGVSAGVLLNPAGHNILYPEGNYDSYSGYAGISYGFHAGYTSYITRVVGFTQEFTYTYNQLMINDHMVNRMSAYALLVGVRFRF